MGMRIVILAGGKGTRMGQPFPKALTPVSGRPILEHLLDTISESGIDSRPVVVIGHQGEQIKEAIGDRCEYAVQTEQLGTGHAVSIAKPVLEGAEDVLVLYGDHPFISKESLHRLSEEHTRKQNRMTLMTTTVPMFDGWYGAFLKWGRILRGADGTIRGIREYKDASEEEKLIKEVNPALFCFNAEWLWSHLEQLGNNNSQKEYYLTDLLGMAFEEGVRISTLSIRPEEAIGINTPEELKVAEGIVNHKVI
jgi:bifunctional UDP-N-acetylglucosamine pyrophosphorylase/glucosamine-1-phosphate N-acetyltransferase